jgi:acyl-CoA thioester hydrolase
VHEKRVEIRWRDVDAFGHVNNAVYATYLEECRDEWLDEALGHGEAAWDYVIARVVIDFRRELRLEDDEVLVRCSLERIGTSSVTTKEEILAGDFLAAEGECVLVARDRETGSSRPLSDDERQAFEMLREQARRTNRKIVDVAEAVAISVPLLRAREPD